MVIFHSFLYVYQRVVSISDHFLLPVEPSGLHSADEHLAEARRTHADEKRRVKAQQGADAANRSNIAPRATASFGISMKVYGSLLF